MYASRFVLGVLALSLLVAGFGCKTGKSGKVPTASPMVSFTAPDREDVFPDEDAEAEGGGESADSATEE